MLYNLNSSAYLLMIGTVPLMGDRCGAQLFGCHFTFVNLIRGQRCKANVIFDPLLWSGESCAM